MAQRESRNRAEAEQEDGESGWCRGKAETVRRRNRKTGRADGAEGKWKMCKAELK